MRWLVDLAYLAAAVLTAPVWMVRMIRTGKIRTDWRARFGLGPAWGGPPLVRPAAPRPRILLHAVSVGEVNAIRLLVDRLAAPAAEGGYGFEVVISTTTDTGFARAQALWKGRHDVGVVRYPFDFSFAVRPFLDRVAPDLVALVELEVWPNFTAECARRGVPIAIINGRLTERSLRRYRRLGELVRRSFRRLALVAAQNDQYALRFREMGVPPERVLTTGNLKWDTAQIAASVPGADELAHAMGIDRSRPLIVAGSTAPGEHELLVAAKPEGAQLLCAPRKPEWFDQAAQAMPGCVRRSRRLGDRGQVSGVREERTGPALPLTPETCHLSPSADFFLLDTIGELRQAYALADVVVIGRSFGNLHGSDMMEPVALGKATVVGPAIADFQETMDALRAGEGIVQTTAAALPSVLQSLLADPARRAELARNGQAVVRQNQGATARTADLLAGLIAKNQPAVAACDRDGGGGERRKAMRVESSSRS